MDQKGQNVTIYLAERPEYGIVPGKTFASKTEPAPTVDDLKDGEVLVETLYLSLDPSMRGVLNGKYYFIFHTSLSPIGIWLSFSTDSLSLQIGHHISLLWPSVRRVSSQSTAAIIGRVTILFDPQAETFSVIGGAVTRVSGSKSAKAKPGDIVHTFSGWTEVAIVPEAAVDTIQLPKGGKITDILMAALRYILTLPIDLRANYGSGSGLKNIAQVKPGETVVVSAAAGANGTLVGQIAKMQGARVIGITGSHDKCDWLCKEVRFDAALNYKSSTFIRDLETATPNEVDVYWDNVGGQLLETMLSRAAKKSRFVICGGISEYNTSPEQRWGVKNIIELGKKRIRMEGFVILDHAQDLPQARAELFSWIEQGKIKIFNTILKGGIEEAENALVKLFEGENIGKLLLEVKAI
ncbi:NAD(P)-binding protein [Apiospora arundinis]|uniref:NAD(P)-binding protein n=1 Tax=Apiospora arundinis TaxID=335852 RepID=A0ABR2JGX2_9PEZI